MMWAAVIAAVLFIGFLAISAATGGFRNRNRDCEDDDDDTKTPAPAASTPPGPAQTPAPGETAGPPRNQAGPPAPGPANLGPCYTTTYHCEHGMIIVNHVLGTERVLRNAEGDSAWIARFERGLRQL